jgi:polysaccharide biosynthesis/export protein
MSIRNFCVALAMGWLAAFGASAQTPVGSAAQPATAGQSSQGVVPGVQTGVADTTSSAYILGRDDVIEVGLIGRSDFGGRARVQADGTIQLPFIGKLAVADRSTAEVSELVRKALQAGGYFADPVVTVEVTGYASRYVVVLGAVGSPGLVPINRPYRMSEILARVGGVKDGAADYLSIRSADGQETKMLIRDLATGDTTKDPYVKAGDKIYAPMAETYYIYGQVGSPGAYPITSDSTVQMAIARAGGLSANGSDKKVDATRGGKKVKLDMAAKIEPGDIIKVGERLF